MSVSQTSQKEDAVQQLGAELFSVEILYYYCTLYNILLRYYTITSHAESNCGLFLCEVKQRRSEGDQPKTTSTPNSHHVFSLLDCSD